MSLDMSLFRTTDAQAAVYDAIKDTKVIEELTVECPQKYAEAPLEEVLYPIVNHHQVLIVAGAFFGDEGKGKTVDALARHPQCSIVARTNSGENAGHTVFDSKGNKFVFHLAPSGLLLDNKLNFVGPECVMDPISFMQSEVQPLIDAGVNYKERLFIGNVHIVTPYHKLLDMLLSAPNSSTLKGMSPIHGSKVTKRGIRLDHIYNDQAVLRSRLKKDMDTYFAVLKLKGMDDAAVVKRIEDENSDGVKRIPDYVAQFASAEDKVEYLARLYNDQVKNNVAFPPRADVTHCIRKALSNGEKVLLEGPQSYWLSNAREKFWESSTSADTAAGGLVATAQYNFQKYATMVINVHKAPGSSRVGIGANPAAFIPQDFFSSKGIRTLRDLPEGACRDFDAIQKMYAGLVGKNGILQPAEFEDATGKYNIGVAMAISSALQHGECGATTLKPRITGLFDCVAHFEVNACQGPYLSISALDRGDEYDEVGLTIAYVYHHPENLRVSCNGIEYKNGAVIHAGDPVPGEAALFYCHPIIKMLPGWKDSPLYAKKREKGAPLPPQVCNYVANVEYYTGARVLSIGNGPHGDNIIYLKRL